VAAPRSNAGVATRLGVVVAIMAGLSFAAVPFYDWFCRVTGYGGTTATAPAPDAPPRAEAVTVRFDANVAPGLGATFRPMLRTMEVRIGESALAFYEFANPTDRPIAGTASFNVAPYSTGGYFAKVECFCFERQELAPGERVEMPVSFFVDPAMLDDPEARGVQTITLSYTMHAADGAGRARLARADATDDATQPIEN
jgi:cytochrome c oxidase assembly protein subunit 11